jgi:hypothetical protein
MSAASDQLDQLDAQQAYLTASLRSMLEGNWCDGPPSVQAYVNALDPNLGVGCVPPYRQSDTPLEPPEPDIPYDASTSQPGQLYSWTCSACASDWVLRAHDAGYDADVYASREQTGLAIGYPEQINSVYGLMDGSGAQLQRVIKEQAGLDTAQGWLTFDQAYAIFSTTPGCASGGAWYHWVGIRGVSGSDLAIANSAPGYMGVWSTLSRADWNRLGPFSCIWVVG